MSGKMTQHQITNGPKEETVRFTETDMYLNFAQGITFPFSAISD